MVEVLCPDRTYDRGAPRIILLLWKPVECSCATLCELDNFYGRHRPFVAEDALEVTYVYGHHGWLPVAVGERHDVRVTALMWSRSPLVHRFFRECARRCVYLLSSLSFPASLQFGGSWRSYPLSWSPQ